MAREKTPEEQTTDNERKQLAEEKKKLKKEQQAQRKEAKRRAKEIAKQEDALDDGSEGSSLLTFGATILIVILWIAVICAVIKLDIGGFGSSVVTPILRMFRCLTESFPAIPLRRLRMEAPTVAIPAYRMQWIRSRVWSYS